ncbi:DNA-directed RNA polymerase II subunit RPB1-like isoform X1 [Hyla sarda]|uniref:DNA-directed RNA polymerase II subunit RPB1-like isoform X1 n=1 Tax=Hyla sarda TaxID=327740 RepID=UPI0024C373A8|nr:DNA-directed RNA polymerase II subunit RPB1-like isoform X1 [Hyla sarda]
MDFPMFPPNQPAIFCVSPTSGLVQPTLVTMPVPVLSRLAPAYTPVSRVTTMSSASPAQMPVMLSPASPESIPSPDFAEEEPAAAPEAPRVQDPPEVVLRRSQRSTQGQLPAS